MMQHIVNKSHKPIAVTNKIRLAAYESIDADIIITEDIKRLVKMGIISISAVQQRVTTFNNNAANALKAEEERIRQLRLQRRIKGAAANETVVESAKTAKAPTRASATNSTSTTKGK